MNDLVMVVAFAPLVAFLLGVTDLVVPLAAGLAVRGRLLSGGTRWGTGEGAVARFAAFAKPASVLGLLATVVLLFGFQAR